MVSNLEKIQRFLTNLAHFLVSLVKILLLSRFKVKYPKSTEEEILFLANGPSLNNALEKIKEDGLPSNIMVSNFFINTPLFEELKPNNICICDPHFKFKGFTNDERVKIFYDKLLSIKWEVNFFLPFSFRDDLNKIIDNIGGISNTVNICYYNDVNFNGASPMLLKLMRMKLGIPRPTTVAIPAIFNCMHMGYKTIKIAGIDLNQHLDIRVSKENELLLKARHFYSDGKEVYNVWYKDIPNKVPYKVSEIFLIFHRFFYSFDILAVYAKKYGFNILNYSETSFLDQFEKK